MEILQEFAASVPCPPSHSTPISYAAITVLYIHTRSVHIYLTEAEVSKWSLVYLFRMAVRVQEERKTNRKVKKSEILSFCYDFVLASTAAMFFSSSSYIGPPDQPLTENVVQSNFAHKLFLAWWPRQTHVRIFAQKYVSTRRRTTERKMDGGGGVGRWK